MDEGKAWAPAGGTKPDLEAVGAGVAETFWTMLPNGLDLTGGAVAGAAGVFVALAAEKTLDG